MSQIPDFKKRKLLENGVQSPTGKPASVPTAPGQSRRKDANGDMIVSFVTRTGQSVDAIKINNDGAQIIGRPDENKVRALVDTVEANGWSPAKLFGDAAFIKDAAAEMRARGLPFALAGSEAEQQKTVEALVEHCKLNNLPMDIHHNSSPELQKLIIAECQKRGMKPVPLPSGRIQNGVQAPSRLVGSIKNESEKEGRIDFVALDDAQIERALVKCLRDGDVPVMVVGDKDFLSQVDAVADRLRIPLDSPEMRQLQSEITTEAAHNRTSAIQNSINDEWKRSYELQAEREKDEQKNGVSSAQHLK